MKSSEKEIPSGLILMNKPPGVTSFDALRDVKRSLGTGKVGHTGTLDKFAEGLLLVLTGRALKLSRWFTGCDKQYTATLCMGTETDTLDPEGKVTAEAEIPSREALEKAIPQFLGTIQQAPPEYSAVHIDGRRAYDLARCGETPEMKLRPVSIYRLELIGWQPPHAQIYVHCSSGTYIRSLARDMALAAGTRAHLRALKRTHVAGFVLSNDNEQRTMPINKSVFRALGIPWLDISPKEMQAMKQGKGLAGILAGKNIVYDNVYEPPQGSAETQALGAFCEDVLTAVLEKEHNTWKYGYVYATA